MREDAGSRADAFGDRKFKRRNRKSGFLVLRYAQYGDRLKGELKHKSQMACRKAGTTLWQSNPLQLKSFNSTCLFCRHTQSSARQFATSPRVKKEGSTGDEGPFRSRLRTALRRTKVEWKPIPVGLGIALLGAIQFYRIREREKRQVENDQAAVHSEGEEQSSRPKKRKRIRPSGPW